MYFHCNQLLGLARDARDRAVKVVEENKDAWPSDAIVAIVLAAASTEALTNELTENLAMTKRLREERGESMPPELSTLVGTLTRMEEERRSTTDKYHAASQVLGEVFDRGGAPYQDFALLMTLRDGIMHLKPRDTFEETAGPDGPDITVSWPNYVTTLQRRRLARTPTEGRICSWFDLLKTVEVALWACDTAHRIMLAVLDMIPDGPNDPCRPLKELLRG